ncbi:hypothetical protein PAHAL_9G223700 [Panicum hallii]|uniref:Uncharacterized protein n=1 Tax=Panicum hallii TaxID=206008 RepID=A0A2T8I248_9POAL|nr:hypothetical protein PAHAL_9G223700 [Panicum hallii]
MGTWREDWYWIQVQILSNTKRWGRGNTAKGTFSTQGKNITYCPSVPKEVKEYFGLDIDKTKNKKKERDRQRRT